jgi:hypothetical protein
MREIVFDLGAAVRSEWPWQGRNMKIQALNGNDIDVGHFVFSALRSAPQAFDPGLARSRALSVREKKFDLTAIDRKT